MGNYVYFNNNPIQHKRVGDCVIRALSKSLDQTWEKTYIGVVLKGFEMGDMPSSNAVWSAYLNDKGFTRHAIPAEYSGRYTVEDFATDHPSGTYVLGLDGHVVCVKDGEYFDSWESGNECPHLYWSK